MFKIMIVEDDYKIREIMIENIKKWNFDAIAVEDFNEVFHTFVKYEPDLVLMDINLPCFDGFYWCNKIREVSRVPIVFISSRNTNMDIIMAINMGADDFIQKPFSLDVLIAKLTAILRRTYSYSNIESNVLEYNGAILNLKDCNLMYNEEKIDLTKNEFKILYTLIKNNREVVSRDKIMKALWEDESFVDDNTLTVNINRLRKKLSDMGLTDFIQTKKGQGYIIQ
ncbi:response regulator transcription factor [Clostridium aciditolerans]|uniref:Stage 0 sporulation protein A homolog n=1 Tax=Clostridium aciditolerans TaxID=339861 RepID=A0A934HX96_9CLOT|nr:response regulator transcription factor [Clostridium aciditolerans]MBI6872267.1 response regulator transcription factor [Clostridium aciditolerans]